MLTRFQYNHIINFLTSFEVLPQIPLDLQLRHYLKQHSAIGSKDRKIVGDLIYDLIRWRGLLDAHLSSPFTWGKRLELWMNTSQEELTSLSSLHPYEKVSFPQEFYDLFLSHRGKEMTDQFCLHSNFPAPLTVRTNLLKTTRTALFQSLSPRFTVSF